MADLIRIDQPEATYCCYSERGLLSYYMFRVVGRRLDSLIRAMSFPQGVSNPFEGNTSSSEVTVFSELDFGTKGFGKPDGALFFIAGRPRLILVESKIGKTYVNSCLRTKYNSTLQGQLELKWRAMYLYKNDVLFQKTKKRHYLRENEEIRDFYCDPTPAGILFGDDFYNDQRRESPEDNDAWRRLALCDGVGDFFNLYVKRCAFGDITFLITTDDTSCPFNSIEPRYLPRCIGKSWDDVKGQFCWVSNTFILNECRHDSSAAAST